MCRSGPFGFESCNDADDFPFTHLTQAPHWERRPPAGKFARPGDVPRTGLVALDSGRDRVLPRRKFGHFIREDLPPMNPPQLSGPEPEYLDTIPVEESGPPVSSFRIQRIIPFLLKYWWIPLVTLILSVGGAAAYIFWIPPTYVSKARMWETIKLRLPEGALFAEDVQNFLGTQTELLQSSTLRELALARMRNSGTNATLPLDRDGQPLPVAVRVTGSSKSSVFLIEATSSDSPYAQAYLEALMNVYLEYKRNIRSVVSGGTLNSIATQVLRTEQELKTEQETFLAFQRTNNMAVLQQEGSVVGGYLATLKTKLSDLLLEDRLLQPATSNLDGNVIAPTNASTALDGAEAAALAGASSLGGGASVSHYDSKDLEMLKNQREKLSKYLKPKHPKIVKLDAEIERGEKLMEIYRRQTREQLANVRQSVRLKIANVQASIAEWESKVVEANSRIGEAERLKINVQRVQNVYDRLALLLQNVGISRNLDQETLAILEPAIPARRSFTKELGLATAAALVGLGLGLAIVLFIAFRDDRFTSMFEVNEKFGNNIIGQVPELISLADGRKKVPLIESEEQRHIYAEAYRGLRSALLLGPAPGERPKVILITSAIPDEGKSTIAVNLSRTLALGGARVLLVDADLRKGRLHEMMEKQREPGLAEVMRQMDGWEKALQTSSLPNLAFLSRGGAISHPGDLFLAASFDELLASFRRQFDYVIIDSSPVFAADDATTLAPKVDGTIFVVRRHFSRAGAVRIALDLLQQRQARILGLVFNRADTASEANYYYKNYYKSDDDLVKSA